MSLSRTGAGANTGVFHLIVRTAAAAGIVAGLLLTGVQHLQVTSIIGQAEVFEAAADAAPAATPAAETGPAPAPAPAPTIHVHADGARHEHAPAHSDAPVAAHSHASADSHSHDAATHGAATHAADHADDHSAGHDGGHEHGGWQPEDGAERTFYTALADVSMGVGYGLLLAAVVCLRGQSMNWRKGLLWGAAGYVVFFLAPSLGLPPELPGTAAAPLAARQGWWVATAMSTATALALLAFSRHWALKLAAVALLIVPHLVGAPQPLVHASAAPENLAQAFLYATAIANAIFWLALGALTGYFYQRFSGARTTQHV